MKTLFLVRHAKASQNLTGLADIDRPLVERGYVDAHAMSKKLFAQSIKPDLIISSHGIRALTTALIFARNMNMNAGKIQLVEKLYNAPNEAVIEIIAKLPENINQVMIFGHNPAISNVTNLLADDFLEHMPTCSISCLDFTLNDWRNIKPRTGKLRFFDCPKNY